MQNTITVPAAIIFAGVLVASAIVYTNQGALPRAERDGGEIEQRAAERPRPGSLDALRPIGADDHLRGSPEAKVLIVEYSDFECPFCKSFHSTMRQVMDEYGASGKVAWVYRHFPLDELHPVKARLEAIATECAAELGGAEAFWKFADRFFELTPSNNRTDTGTLLPQIAAELGLDASAFASCLTSDRHNARIDGNAKNAAETGGLGTPWSILVDKNGKKTPIDGAQSYGTVRGLIEQALAGN